MLLLPSFQYRWHLIKPITGSPPEAFFSGSRSAQLLLGRQHQLQGALAFPLQAISHAEWAVFMAYSKGAWSDLKFTRSQPFIPIFMNNSGNYLRLVSIGKHLLQYFIGVDFSQLLHPSIHVFLRILTYFTHTHTKNVCYFNKGVNSW